MNPGLQAIEDKLDEMFSSSTTVEGTTGNPQFMNMGQDLHSKRDDPKSLIYTAVEVNGVPAQALVDSAGNVSFINNEIVNITSGK